MTRSSLSVTYFAFTALHFVCFALAITVCGLYGTDLQRAKKFDDYTNSKWVYAVVVGALSAATCALYFIPFIIEAGSIFVASWDAILFVLWITLFGVFGKLYIHENAHGNGNIERMKHAVWVDLTSALLWLTATVATVAYWWKHRNARTVFTGRAKV
ncbi:hypothetical protein ACSS6W_000378 [Trichoderma asperelloides]|uniref:MARVEL domain-containing protein n=1 Tax=Trichoderma asperellum TaxID=101201 RepID=A0A6V8QKE0_TRIAP|nr:hypothetical protein LI328DRAFT_125560 [Trichoderma asperelloides]GFP52947.1 hypothetical protein TASIC1_0002013100 [Trichoderma asperellum]